MSTTHASDRARRFHRLAAISALLLVAGVAACSPDTDGPPDQDAVAQQDGGYEVWIVDQADSDHEAGYGGWLNVFSGADLEGADPASAEPLARVDLGGWTRDLCRGATGADPVRPHMLLFNEAGTHAVVSFVGSGHVVVFDAARREAVDCFRASPGVDGIRQAHAAFPSPDGRHIVIANQNGKLLERIDADFEAGVFTHNTEATLDLANGTTPAGFAREDSDLRPDNAPICPVIDEDSRYTWVTLRGGGLFVVDHNETPMRIVAEYDRETVLGNGCGGVQAGGAMYLNSGGAPVNLGGEPHPHLSLHRFDIYRFPLSGYEEATAPNEPTPELIFQVDGERDSHGMAPAGDGSHVWVVDRHANLAEVFEAETGSHVNTVELAGPVSDNPAPDLVDVSPTGELIFASLRGSVPLTGDPHNATGTTPGLGLIRVEAGGRDGELAAVVPFSNLRDGENVADPHAVRVRHLR